MEGEGQNDNLVGNDESTRGEWCNKSSNVLGTVFQGISVGDVVYHGYYMKVGCHMP